MKPQGTRIGTYLLWMVSAASGPSLLLAGIALDRLHTQWHQQQDNALIEQARDIARPISLLFEQLQTGLQSAAASDALMRGDIEAVTREMRSLSRDAGDVDLALLTRQGNVLSQVGRNRLGEPAWRKPLRQGAILALQDNAPIVTNLLDADDPATRSVIIAVPGPRSPSAAAYALAAILPEPRLTELANLAPTEMPDVAITIRDRAGVAVARSSRSHDPLGETAAAPLRQAIATQSDGVLPGAAAGQTRMRQAFSTTAVGGYVVVAGAPVAGFMDLMRDELFQPLALSVILLLLGICGALYLGQRLVGMMRTVGPDAPPSGVREVDELASQLHGLDDQRVSTQTSLQEQRIRLRDLVTTLDLATILSRDLDGTIRFWSRGCERLYGWTQEQAVGQSCQHLLRTQFPVPLQEIEQHLLQAGEWRGDLVHRHKDGTPMVVAVHKALKRDSDGRPHSVVESLVDVTALREAQDILRDINQRLEQRVRDEVSARELAQQHAANADRIKALGQLAGGIAHDFNNVLQAVAGGAALIGRRPQDVEAVARLVQLIGEAAARGAAITRRMLVLARRGDLRAEPVDPRTLLDDMRDVFVHTLGAAITIVVETEPSLPRLLADVGQLETALMNLATNARDAMPDGGTLRLTAGLDVIPTGQAHPAGLGSGTYIRLVVADNGSGMTGSTLARVGEPFFTTKGVGKGTGLGLSMVKGFADQSGGGMLVTSAVGAGTTVTLWLPALAADLRTERDPVSEAGRRQVTGRILLVDDDKLVRETVTEQLEELGHKVLAASDGTDALAILRAREAVDIMITDLSMPGMNGLMLIKEAHDLRPSLPAILLTGFASDADALQDSDPVRDSYTLLRKPATSAALNARVIELLER